MSIRTADVSMAHPDKDGAADWRRTRGAESLQRSQGAAYAQRDKCYSRGNWQLLAGGVLVIASPFLLVRGLDEALFERYIEGGGTLTHGVVLVALAAALLLPGAALLLVGFCLRHAFHRGWTGVAGHADGHARHADGHAPPADAADALQDQHALGVDDANRHSDGHRGYSRRFRGRGIQTGV